jgi:hypothetical protein
VPGLRVAGPVHVVDVHPPRRRQYHLVDDGGQRLGVVADHDEAAAVRGQERAQPGDRVGVGVVGGLVEERGGALGAPPPRRRTRRTGSGALDPAPLAGRWPSSARARARAGRWAQIRAASLSAAYPPRARSALNPRTHARPARSPLSTGSAIADCAFSILRSISSSRAR